MEEKANELNYNKEITIKVLRLLSQITHEGKLKEKGNSLSYLVLLICPLWNYHRKKKKTQLQAFRSAYGSICKSTSSPREGYREGYGTNWKTIRILAKDPGSLSSHQSFQTVWFEEDKMLQGESWKCIPHGD